MEKRVLVLTMSAFILACGATTASAQQSPGSPTMQQPSQQPTQQEPVEKWGPGIKEHEGMMGHGMMGRGCWAGHGMMGHGGMMGPVIMRIIFALMDSDGDGTISLQEFQAAHERIFKAMDVDKDGTVSFEEMQNFVHGTRRSVPHQ